MALRVGFEPTQMLLESTVLPLNYLRLVPEGGLVPPSIPVFKLVALLELLWLGGPGRQLLRPDPWCQGEVTNFQTVR